MADGSDYETCDVCGTDVPGYELNTCTFCGTANLCSSCIAPGLHECTTMVHEVPDTEDDE